MMYFASNQKKQRAFDRTYNAMARSNFVQGHKLKTLIQKEAADSALADQLAQLYMQAVGKNIEYDYNTINDKLQRKPPPVIKSKPKKAKQSTQAKRAYVQESTDTHKKKEASSNVRVETEISDDELEEKAPIPQSPTAAAHASFMNEQATQDFIKGTAAKYPERHDGFKTKNLDKVLKDQTTEFIKRQLQGRKDKVKSNRVYNTALRDAIVDSIRDSISSASSQSSSPLPSPPSTPPRSSSSSSRTSSPRTPSPNLSPRRRSPSGRPLSPEMVDLISDPIQISRVQQQAPTVHEVRDASKRKRPTTHGPMYISPNTREKKSNTTRQLQEGEEIMSEETRRDLAEKQRLYKYNARVKAAYTRDIEGFSDLSRSGLYNEVKKMYKSDVDDRMGDGYFDHNAPPHVGRGRLSIDEMQMYKKDMKDWLDRIFVSE